MSRAGLIFLFCIVLPGLSSGRAAAAGFDMAGAASVWAAALHYIAPRALQKLQVSQMAIWGLQGLTALDPDLSTVLQDGQVQLFSQNRLLAALPAPGQDDAPGWGEAAARVAAAGFAASQALQQAGTQGLIGSFFDELFNHFDPYSRYEPPLQAAQEQLLVTGIAGTGLTLARQGGDVVIASVAADSPAFEAGLQPGFEVVAIDGRPVRLGAIATLNANLAGIPGSRTTLHVRDPQSADAASDVVLTRAFVPPPTVFAEVFPQTGGAASLLAFRITGFNEGTSDQFTAALGAGLAQSTALAGLLIDLRGNRGGVLRQAVLTADSLLPGGTIVSAAGRDPDADQRFVAEGGDITAGLPMLVLVDGQTASAAEILAAALADNRRAVVIGSATLGKGLVQAVTALPDGGELLVTWSRVLAPRGWPLQSLGVIPQICTSLGPRQLDAQLGALAHGSNPMAAADAQARSGRAPMPIGQILAIRNACPADIGGDLDFTAARFLMANPAAYATALLPAQ